MKDSTLAVSHFLDDYARDHAEVVSKSFLRLGSQVEEVGKVLIEALQAGRKVLVFGNGGSATQASHFAGELMGRFSRASRGPLPAVALASDPGISTCIGNDFGFGALFERQLEALARPGDVAIALTTSGRSENVLRGLRMASHNCAVTVALTGEAGLAGAKPGHLLKVPSRATHHVQEVHLVFLHLWCIQIDEGFRTAFPSRSRRRS